MPGLLVTGTDTDAGKTVLASVLLAGMRAAGLEVRAYKPVLTGLEQQASDGRARRPADHELLGAAAGMDCEQVAPLRYRPAVSPHLAAALAGERVDPLLLLERARGAGCEGTLVVEGAGGLLSPLCEDYTVLDFAADLGLPVLVAARPGLGTINHTLLTLKAARAGGLEVRAVILTPWPARPGALERSNRATIARMGAVPVHMLATLESFEPETLAAAAGALPWREWLGERGKRPAAMAQPAPTARAAATTAAPTLASSGSPIT